MFAKVVFALSLFKGYHCIRTFSEKRGKFFVPFFYIESGSVKGYVKAEFVLTGEAAEIRAKEVGKRLAEVTTTTLKVRKDPSTEAQVLGLVPIEDVLNDENLQACTAVKEQNVYQIPREIECWDSPVPGSILGNLWLASVLHPEAYTAEMYEEAVVEYYETFYGFTP